MGSFVVGRDTCVNPLPFHPHPPIPVTMHIPRSERHVTRTKPNTARHPPTDSVDVPVAVSFFQSHCARLHVILHGRDVDLALTDKDIVLNVGDGLIKMGGLFLDKLPDDVLQR